MQFSFNPIGTTSEFGYKHLNGESPYAWVKIKTKRRAVTVEHTFIAEAPDAEFVTDEVARIVSDILSVDNTGAAVRFARLFVALISRLTTDVAANINEDSRFKLIVDGHIVDLGWVE